MFRHELEWSYEEMFSASQMNLQVGTDVSYGAGNLNAQFNWNTSEQKTRIMAKYKQIYFSVDMDTPTSPRALFPGDISAGRAQGRLSCRFDADVRRRSELRNDGPTCASRPASPPSRWGWRSMPPTAHPPSMRTLDFGLKVSEVFAASSVKIIVYGGSTSQLGELETGYEGFKKVIAAGKDFTQNLLESPWSIASTTSGTIPWRR